ncbi:MAG: isochorismatase family protein [Gemmatimonadales bacterium]
MTEPAWLDGRTIFWDVDTQVDFIHADGLLAVPGGVEIIPALKRLTDFAHASGIRIVATADDHDLGHAEILTAEHADWRATFPPHCMRDTPGQRKIPETTLHDHLLLQPVPVDLQVARTIAAHHGDILLHKPALDVFEWNPHAAVVLSMLAPQRVVIYGVATDFCVAAAVGGLRRLLPDAELVVARDAIAAVDAPSGTALCDRWCQDGIRLADAATITG